MERRVGFIWFSVLLLVGSCISVQPIAAQEGPEGVTVNNTQHPSLELLKTVNGKTVNLVRPRERVRYRIDCANTGDAPATDVVITDAVPPHTTFINWTAWGPPGSVIEYSTNDGLGWLPDPPVLKTTTHLRWRVDQIDPGVSMGVGFQARISPEPWAELPVDSFNTAFATCAETCDVASNSTRSIVGDWRRCLPRKAWIKTATFMPYAGRWRVVADIIGKHCGDQNSVIVTRGLANFNGGDKVHGEWLVGDQVIPFTANLRRGRAEVFTELPWNNANGMKTVGLRVFSYPEIIEARPLDIYKSGFDPRVHGWKFANQAWPAYRVPNLDCNLWFVGQSVGMSYTACDHYFQGLPLPDDGWPTRDNRWLIHNRQMDALPTLAPLCHALHDASADPFTASAWLAQEYGVIRDKIMGGDPWPVTTATYGDTLGHEVVAFALAEVADAWANVFVYDPYYPGERGRFIRLQRQWRPSTGWYWPVGEWTMGYFPYELLGVSPYTSLTGP